MISLLDKLNTPRLELTGFSKKLHPALQRNSETTLHGDTVFVGDTRAVAHRNPELRLLLLWSKK